MRSSKRKTWPPKSSASTAFRDNAFVTGNPASTGLLIQELDGTTSSATVNSTTYTNFHHNIDPGKTGTKREPVFDPRSLDRTLLALPLQKRQ